jgi:hypothetical protein
VSSLANELKGLRPGDMFPVPDQGAPLRIVGLHGREGAPIVLTFGAVAGDRSTPYGLRLQECSFVIVRSPAVSDCWGDEARGIQIWGGSDVLIEDPQTSRIALDHIHSLATRVTIRRHHADGSGGKAGRGGAIGAHAGVYFTTLDDGEDCEDLVYEDAEVVNSEGAPLQANGDRHALRRVRFSRVRLVNWLTGPGINLEGVEDSEDENGSPVPACIIEDLEARSGKVDGIHAVNCGRVELARFVLQVGGTFWQGNVKAFPGTPAPPSFDAAPPPAPQPPAPQPPAPAPPPSAPADDALRAMRAERDAAIATLEGERRRWAAWLAQAPAPAS